MRNSILLGSLLFAVGCLHKDDGSSLDTAASAVDSSESTEAEGTMMMSAVDGSDMTGLTAITDVQVAARIAANVPLRWLANCATVTTTGATVAITFDDCTGPRGLVHVTGELDLAITVSSAGAISVHGTATNLQVNQATLDIDVDAAYAVSGTSHTLTVTTNGSGVGPRGNTIDHDGDYTVTWDTTSQCGSLAGHWSTELGDRTRSNEVNVMRCAGGCPTGTVTHDFLAGASVTITFDGSDVASWSGSGGGSGTVNLACK